MEVQWWKIIPWTISGETSIPIKLNVWVATKEGTVNVGETADKPYLHADEPSWYIFGEVSGNPAADPCQTREATNELLGKLGGEILKCQTLGDGWKNLLNEEDPMRKNWMDLNRSGASRMVSIMRSSNMLVRDIGDFVWETIHCIMDGMLGISFGIQFKILIFPKSLECSIILLSRTSRCDRASMDMLHELGHDGAEVPGRNAPPNIR